VEHSNLRPSAGADGGRGPLSNSVDGKNGSLVIWRAKEGAGRVRKVVLAEENARMWQAQTAGQHVSDPQLFAQPGDHRFLKEAP
jgi:hypothetical protein